MRRQVPELASSVREVMQEGVVTGAYPGAALWVAREGRCLGEHVVGTASLDTYFDLASLTKPMVTVEAALRAVSAGILRLDDPVDPLLPPALTVRALLGHRAGLPAWEDISLSLPRPLVPGSAATRLAAHALVRRAARDADPRRGVVYSDLGFILLGAAMARLWQTPIQKLKKVGKFRGINRPAQFTNYAPTGYCAWRAGEVCGVVHDPNAWLMGGAAGHAGLFGRVREVGAWAAALERLDATGRAGGTAHGIDPGVLRAFWDPAARDPGATWVLGWDTPSPGGVSSGGALIGARAVGHLGFTGTSVWIDRERRQVVVLLSNRVALGEGAQAKLRALRPRLHDAVTAWADGL